MGGAGADREQTIIAKVGSWFVKMDPKGHWGLGVFTGKSSTSVFTRERAPVGPAPVALATPPAPAPASPPAATPAKPGNWDSNRPLIIWAVVLVVAIGAWLVYMTRRNRGPAEASEGGSGDGSRGGSAPGSHRAPQAAAQPPAARSEPPPAE